MINSDSNPKVVVVLVNWNGWPDTVECLRSLDAIEYPNCDVIVVDNHSDDDSVDMLRDAYPDLRLLENPEDRGFAGGCNPGIMAALKSGADYVWLLNSDTKIRSDALCHMVEEAARGESIGAVGSVIHYMAHPAKIQAWGGGKVGHIRGSCKEFTRRPRGNSLHYLTGASLLIKREVIEEVGLLDEGFFMYWEDTDWCFRIRNAGWRLSVADQSRVFHKVATSFGGRRKRNTTFEKHFNESAVRFFRKWSRRPTIPIFLGLSQRILHRLLLGRWARAVAAFRVLAGVLSEEPTENKALAGVRTKALKP